ncbi:ubiquitin-activating emzyme E1 [Chytridium lagenaria]|nr:ubiquitin-activating emzyme E1 [Chytridium lagenaria]
MSTPMDVEPSGTIDESLYSRQLYVLGHKAMLAMSLSNVLIVGMKGLGVEIAKNVILAGVKSVTLHDLEPAEVTDLSAQFYLTPEDLGKPRAQSTAAKLAELNNYVPVNVLNEELTEANITNYQVVVVTDVPLERQLAINSFTHKHGIKFISADVRGLFGMAFNDFGPEFAVQDQTGEEPVSGMIAGVEKGTDAVVACLEEHRHGLEDGDYVTFTEVKGMVELNGIEPRKVTVTGPYTFKIGDTTNFGGYVSGGIFTQVKQPKILKFLPLKDALIKPEFVMSDYAKFDRPAQLHVGFQALDKFRAKAGGLLGREINKISPEPTELDEKLIKELAYQSRGIIAPMTAVLGGLVAQEVLKACSGKFGPIHQVPSINSALTEEACKPEGSRYDGQLAVFGKDFQEKVKNSRQFLIYITDMDTIERSNLNRQFLFRPKDVSKLKSSCAAEAVTVMNKDLTGKIESFADRFWESLTGVTNALDNVEARKYVDRRCVYYLKPLLESGTLGTKGNTQVVIPHLTESYSSSNDPPEKSIPICTLKNFPNAIEHTIQWARDLFEGLFRNPAENVNLFLTQANFVETTLKSSGSQKEMIDNIIAFLVTAKPLTFDECIIWARLKYEELFSNQILQLLFNFRLTPAPRNIPFSVNDPLHLDFVIAAANLHAFQLWNHWFHFKSVLNNVIVPEFQPKSGVKIQVQENEAAQAAPATILRRLWPNLPNPSSFAGVRLAPADFEKDDDTNFHIDFITAASNLRASIKPSLLLGKIIPAIATTTSLVTGLVAWSFSRFNFILQIIDGRTKVDDYKNGFINLALPFFDSDVDGDITLKQFIDLFKEKHELEVTMMSSGVSMIYTMFMPKKKMEERMNLKLSELIETVSRKPIPPHVSYIVVEVCVNDKDGEDVEVPYVRIRIR